MRICAIGDNCIDNYQSLGIACPGGNAVNVAVYFKRMGGESSYIGSIGTDHFGQLLISGLQSKGVDVSHIHIDEGKTAVTMVELTDTERVFGDYDEGVMADFRLNEDDRKFVEQHDLVISGFWGHCEDEFQRFHQLGILTAFDFATKLEDPLVKKVVPHIDYPFFAYDGEDIEWLKNFMKEVHRLGPKITTVTRGELGSICYDGHTFYEYGIIDCDVVDTMGAGDSYIAGFLYALLNSKSIQECMEAGSKNSSITIGYKGAW